MGVFNLAGGPFLQLYVVLFALTIAAGWIIPRWLRPEGNARTVTDPDLLAYLAGGTTRYAEAVVARLLSRGALTLCDNRFAIEQRGSGQNAAERAVLALPSPPRWSAVARAAAGNARDAARRLIDDGLLIDASVAWQMRLWQTLPYMMLFAFGAAKLSIGVSRDRPVGYLTALLLATAVLGVIRLAVLDRKTRGGQAAVAEARVRSERLRRAPTAGETDVAVALFGTTVLAGSAWAGFDAMRRSSGSDGAGSDGGSGDGGSGGCGGGGCGGCGS